MARTRSPSPSVSVTQRRSRQVDFDRIANASGHEHIAPMRLGKRISEPRQSLFSFPCEKPRDYLWVSVDLRGSSPASKKENGALRPRSRAKPGSTSGPGTRTSPAQAHRFLLQIGAARGRTTRRGRAVQSSGRWTRKGLGCVRTGQDSCAVVISSLCRGCK